MKEWKKPEVEVLELKCTENGTAISPKVDEARVDEIGNWWYSFSGTGK